MEWIVARWVTFIATMLAVGACAVGLAVMPRVESDIVTRQSIGREVAWVGIGAVVALLPAACMRLADQVLALRSPGDPWFTGIEALLTSTTWGTGFFWQSASSALAGVGFWLVSRTPKARWPWLPATLGAFGLCVTPAMQGHAIGAENASILTVASDIAHVAGASLWLGSLGVIALLGIALPNADGIVSPARRDRAETRLRLLIPLIPPVGIPGVALLLGSGLLATYMHLRALRDLWTVPWGLYVLAKLVLVSVIVLLGALNWRRFGPRMTTTAGVDVMRKSLVTELLLALLVLLVTAVLVVTPLPGE